MTSPEDFEMTRAFFLLSLIVLAACSRAHSADGAPPRDAAPPEPDADSLCEAAGGHCQTPDLPCSEAESWAGYDRCGDVGNNSCCLPRASVAPLPSDDAGMPAGEVDAGTPIDTPDAGTPIEPDAGAAVPRAGAITCGARECDAATEGCLASCVYATDERMPACVAVDGDGRWPDGDCPTGREVFPRLWLTCDGNEDCPAGELCHMIHGSLGQYAYCDACEPPCDPRWFNQLCRSDAECPTEAPTCAPTPDLPGYSVCQES
jgi:hypothetical protein